MPRYHAHMSLEQKLEEISLGVADALKDEGLYMERTVIAKGDNSGRLLETMPESIEQVLEEVMDGQPYVMVAHLRVGDRAFHPRVEDPEQYETDREARKIIPTEADMIRDKIEAGEDPFSLDDDEDDEEG